MQRTIKIMIENQDLKDTIDQYFQAYCFCIDKGKRFNRKLGNWSYYQLGNFIQYKAEELGKKTIKINPKHTSQKCSKCGHTERLNRKGSRFKCKKCGFELNADLNASRNIAILGKSQFGRLNVIQPNVALATTATSPRSLEVGR